jgi:hypothetical protein
MSIVDQLPTAVGTGFMYRLPFRQAFSIIAIVIRHSPT